MNAQERTDWSEGDRDDLFEWSITEALFAMPPTIFVTAWAGHIPFLFALIKLARPRSYVELGVHFGGSFVAACAAVQRYRTDTVCIGIDNWQGDLHAGKYEGDEIFERLLKYLDSNFSTAILYRENFSDGLKHVEDGSVDILHFDGLHTFDAIQQDFLSWSPKLSKRGIALFHDTAVKEAEFGVWKFWEEIKSSYRTMEFFHSAGLGVAFIGQEQPEAVQRMLSLWETNTAFREFFRTTCEHLGRALPDRMATPTLDAVNILTTRCRTWKLLWPITRFSKAFRLVASLNESGTRKWR
ncbi:MAG TPA: class I SAM-dependent methyltransferase [Candidatus Kapabacteria bacterium]|nr:class I SAM-dependent methyltransferase [Candidatus Kapabacteria bacterium]